MPDKEDWKILKNHTEGCPQNIINIRTILNKQ